LGYYFYCDWCHERLFLVKTAKNYLISNKKKHSAYHRAAEGAKNIFLQICLAALFADKATLLS
jgi:hypothetical protein